MTNPIHEAADHLRELILRHIHMPSPQSAGFLRDYDVGFARHPLDPTGAGGKLALFVVEALSHIIRSIELSAEQIARLNSILDSIGTRIGNLDTDARDLLQHVQKAADPATDDTADLNLLQTRLQGIVDRLGTIDQAITNAGNPAAVAQPTGTSAGAPADQSGSAGASTTEPTGGSTSSGTGGATQTSSGTGQTATGDGTQLTPGA